MIVQTLYSTYVVDEEAKRVKRIAGEHDPTVRQGLDGVWKVYESVIVTNVGLLLVWDSEGRATLTSRIVSVDGLDE